MIRSRFIYYVVFVMLGGILPISAYVQSENNPVYGDNLTADWENWSWGGSYTLDHSGTVYDGNTAVEVQFDEGWGGFYLRYNGSDTTLYEAITFWAHGGNGGQSVRFYLNDDGGTAVPVTLTAGSWQEITIPFSELGGASTVTDMVWQEATGTGGQAPFYLDEIVLVPYEATTVSGPTLTIDTTSTQHDISPYIYGINDYADDQLLATEFSIPVRRWGGNHTTRYNWQNSMTNLGSDWYFENIPLETADIGALPAGSASDQYVAENLSTGTESLVTVPIMGWTADRRTEGHPYDCGFNQGKYGTQQDSDPYESDCGNGILPNGDYVTGNDPADTSKTIDPSFVSGWVNHLMSTHGEDAVMFYALDNEPMLWDETHRDVHPEPPGYDEVLDKGVAYAAAIRATDPDAQILGPTLFGWTAYWYSALDGAGGGEWWLNPPDRLAHGNVPFAPWYLQEMAAYEAEKGERLLDYFDLHYYPQADGVALAPAGNATTQALRLRSTRALWDPTYEDESWIRDTEGGPAVRLIPRMHEWVDEYYPGTKLAITEYNWGALDHINGALAQADVLGIFGRERVDLATLWAPPTPTEPGAFAFRMYRNYDGNGGQFGDLSLAASSSDQDQLAVYAAEHAADGTLTIMVINKTNQPLESTLNISGLNGNQAAEVYRYSAADLAQIVQESNLFISNDTVQTTFPPSSITLLVLSQQSASFDQAVYLPSIMNP